MPADQPQQRKPPSEISLSKAAGEAPPERHPLGQESPAGGEPIGGGEAIQGGLPIRSEAGPPAPGRPVEGEPEFGQPGASVEQPGAYFGTSPVGGPSSLFNIGGAPIAVMGGVFGGGMPLGGPVTQIFRSGAPIPNTLFVSTLQPSGPIAEFLLPGGGGPIGPGPFGRPGVGGLPFSQFFGEGAVPIFAAPLIPGIGRPIGEQSFGGLQL